MNDESLLKFFDVIYSSSANAPQLANILQYMFKDLLPIINLQRLSHVNNLSILFQIVESLYISEFYCEEKKLTMNDFIEGIFLWLNYESREAPKNLSQLPCLFDDRLFPGVFRLIEQRSRSIHRQVLHYLYYFIFE